MDCGEGSPTSAGPQMANFLGTPTATENRPAFTDPRSTELVTPSTVVLTAPPGESPDIEEMLK